MKAARRPRPTWSVALWWEWYISEPCGVAVNSYVNFSPGAIGFWVTNGTPSWKKSSNATPWKWTPVVSLRLFVKIARTLSPSVTRSWGPGQILLYPSAFSGAFIASILWSISSMVSSKTFTPLTIFGLISSFPLRDLGELRDCRELRVVLSRRQDVGELRECCVPVNALECGGDPDEVTTHSLA